MNIAFNLLSIICLAIFMVAELHSPYLAIVFIAGSVVRYQLQKLFIEPASKGSLHPYAHFYDHARQWAARVSDHSRRNPMHCQQCQLENPR